MAPLLLLQATYSGVPVYECIINNVAVMRRRSDSWLNATQILKVVGLDKPVQIVPLGAKDSDIVNMAALAAYNIGG